MDFYHKPVLLNECIGNLNIKPDGTYVDGTLGGAGHSEEIYKRLEETGILLGIDQDEEALAASRERLEAVGGKGKLILVKGNFRNIGDICNEYGIRQVDGVLLDIGVSSHQFDEAGRGFSYKKDAPLDMRMDRSQELNAEIIVNEYAENALKEVIRKYGEEKWASRIAEFIVRSRQKGRIKSTVELAEIIKAAIPAAARREGPHPAKRTFQALRIEVNDELGALKEALESSISLLKPGGRICVITFHSLEDRIVKTVLKEKAQPCTCPKEFPACMCGKSAQIRILTRKPITAAPEEIEENPRSRSAKLRVAEKI